MTTENQHLKIIKLEASNIKRLKAVTIKPTGDVVIITGENDSGKTSTLDAIAYALGGKDLIDAVPIRTGASKAKVTVDLGEFKVTRSFSGLGGSTLTIEDKSGAPARSPQTLLDKLCSRIAFDPLEFKRMTPDKQLDTLRKLVGLDFTKLDALRKSAYETRTLVNRDLKAAQARAAEVEVDPETPDEEVVVSDLMASLTALQGRNANNALKRAGVNTDEKLLNEAADELKAVEKDIKALEERLAELRKEQADLAGDITVKSIELGKKKDAVAALVDEDETPLKTKISEAGTINAKVRDKKRYAALKAEVEKTQKRTDDLTAEIEGYDKAKSDQLAAAKFPLPGLSFDDTGVLLNGVPFTQGSQAQQLQAAIAIGIAMNPTVRVILVRDASLLDDRSMELVAKMAAEHDMQFWLERVSDDAPGAIIIEDGAVKEVVGE